MRAAWPTPLLLCLLSACGEPSGPTACEVGPQIYEATLAALRAREPDCMRDDECVLLDSRLDCAGLRIDACGSVMHRAAATSWQADQVCAEIERETVPSDYGCTTAPTCVDPGEPVCRAGRCVGSKLPDTRADLEASSATDR